MAMSRNNGPRIRREKNTVTRMIALYCLKEHGKRERTPGRVAVHHPAAVSLCDACAELHRYAEQRLDRCRFGEGKTTCQACPVHCYAPVQREQIRRVMAFAGPRMLWRHPVLTLMHLLDGVKKGHSQ